MYLTYYNITLQLLTYSILIKLYDIKILLKNVKK